LPHEILVWTGEKPAARIQERARSARYGLLEEAARANGASCLLTAHHADDQAETVLFRFLRGSNVAGLAGMPARRRLGGVLHARPFLSIRKRDLEAYCERLGQAWLRDPSNEDARFARARLRAASAALAANGFAPPDLLRLARRAARSEAALRAAYATFSREVGAQEGPGRRIGRDVLEAAPEEFVIRWIVDSVSGLTGASPRLEQVESLVDDVRGALDRSARIRRTLGGVMCDLSWNEFALAPESPRRTEASSPSRRGDPCV
jgi:tRNA(Ile)-lysidine synthase